MSKGKLELKVILETNLVISDSPSELLRKEIVDLINSHSKPSDIVVSWYLPEIVINERRFQMNKKAKELFPNVQKLEKLLGHNLNITDDILEDRVDRTITNKLQELKIQEIKLDVKSVDWTSMIKSSVERVPPFSPGDKEKGFRDAVILECVQQLIDQSPKSPTVCRIVFMTADNLLIQAFSEKNKTNKNVSTLPKSEELNSFINILSSTITGDLINSIANDAFELFYKEDDQNTLFYKADVLGQIRQTFKTELNVLPDGANNRDETSWNLSKPVFEKKIKQKIYWKSPIEVKIDAYRQTYIEKSNLVNMYTAPAVIDNPRVLSGSIASVSEWTPHVSNLVATNNNLGFGNFPWTRNSKTELISKGVTKFEVRWTVILTASKKLKNPVILEIKHMSTVWERPE